MTKFVASAVSAGLLLTASGVSATPATKPAAFFTQTGKAGTVAVSIEAGLPKFADGTYTEVSTSYSCDTEALSLGRPITAADLTGRGFEVLAGRAATGPNNACAQIVPDGEGGAFFGAVIQPYAEWGRNINKGEIIMFAKNEGEEGQAAPYKWKGLFEMSVDFAENSMSFTGGRGGQLQADTNYIALYHTQTCDELDAADWVVTGAQNYFAGATDTLIDADEVMKSGVFNSGTDGNSINGKIKITAPNLDGVADNAVTLHELTVTPAAGATPATYTINVAENQGCGEIVATHNVQGYVAVSIVDTAGQADKDPDLLLHGHVTGLQKNVEGSFHVHQKADDPDNASIFPDCESEATVGGHLLGDDKNDYFALPIEGTGNIPVVYQSDASGVATLSALVKNTAATGLSLSSYQYQAIVVHTRQSRNDLSLERRIGCGNLSGKPPISNEDGLDPSAAAQSTLSVAAVFAAFAAALF